MQPARQHAAPANDDRPRDDAERNDNVELHDLLTRAFGTEQDASVLNAAIAALGQVPEMVSANSGETRPIITRLRELTAHTDASIRGASLCALAMWDRSEAIEDHLHQGLVDPALPVRQAAISAVGYSGVRSEHVKSTLLNIIRSRDEDPSIQVRAAALLGHDFALTPIEHGELHHVQLQIRAGVISRSRVAP